LSPNQGDRISLWESSGFFSHPIYSELALRSEETVEEPITRKQRTVAKAALVAKLGTTLAEARERSQKAVEAHLERYPRKPGEFYEYGGAVLLVRKPSPTLRNALSALGTTSTWPTVPVSWEVKTGYHTPKGIGGTGALQEVAERAAQSVLAERFPEEEFWVHTWVD
jgi:hypothetical protein